MKTIDSDALDEVFRALGLSGPRAPVTEFASGQLEQTINVEPLVRRGRTQALTTGIYSAILETNHAGADTQVASVDPYNVGTGVIAPYPDPVGRGFDVWLLAAGVRQSSGSGTLSGLLTMAYPASSQGWGVDEAGAAVVSNAEQVVAFWDGLATVTIGFGILNQLGVQQKIGQRVPRGGSLIVWRSTSSAAAVFLCTMLIGVFPVALGQDGLV